MRHSEAGSSGFPDFYVFFRQTKRSEEESSLRENFFGSHAIQIKA